MPPPMFCRVPPPASPGWTKCLTEGLPGTGYTCSREAPAPERPQSLCNSFWPAPRPARSVFMSALRKPKTSCGPAPNHTGWAIGDNLVICELVPPESVLDPDHHQSLLYSSDLELGETVQRIFDAIERLKPMRVVIDSLSEIRLLA